MYVSSDNHSVVVDIGTENIRIGYSDLEYPTYFETSCTFRNDYVSPVQKSTIKDLEGYLKIVNENIPIDTSYLTICENTFEDPQIKRGILSRIMEGGYADSIFFSKSAILDTFSYGKTTALNISISSGSIQISSIINGYITAKCMVDTGCYDLTKKYAAYFINNQEIFGLVGEISGSSLYKYIDAGLSEPNGNAIGGYKSYFYFKAAKEELYNIMKQAKDKMLFELPEEIYKINDDVNTCILDALEKINEIINENDEEKRGILLNNVVISGGGSFICNIDNIIESYLYRKFANVKTRIVSTPSSFHTFFGGAIVSNIGCLKAMHISKQDYLEYGTTICDRKKFEWNV